MAASALSPFARALRRTDALSDAIGVRPLGLAVFAGSALLLAQLSSLGSGTLRADAVASAALVDHPSRAASFVTRVFVKSGDRVELGQPLVELSPYFIDQRIVRFDAEIEELIDKSKLAQAELVVEEQRFVAPGLRTRPRMPSLEHPTAEFFAKQLEVLRTHRQTLVEDRKSLTVPSSFAGRVAQLAWLGASIAEGASVASILPDQAEEIVAYLPPTTEPGSVSAGAEARLVGVTSAACQAAGHVTRLGAAVEAAPEQLRGMLMLPVHGTPVHISLPPSCVLGIGQVVSVELSLARAS